MLLHEADDDQSIKLSCPFTKLTLTSCSLCLIGKLPEKEEEEEEMDRLCCNIFGQAETTVWSDDRTEQKDRKNHSALWLQPRPAPCADREPIKSATATT